MKKLVFTAIAMVAFSGASMANTKEIEIKEITTTIKDASKCQLAAVATYEFLMDSGCGQMGSGCGGDDIELLNDLLSICNK